MAAGGTASNGGAGSYRNRRSLLVVVGGQTLIERHDAGSRPDTTYNVQSAGKSILSTLVGIAVGEGRLRLDGTLGQLLPPYRPLMSAGVAAITLRQLLTMTGGLPADYYAKVFGPGIAPDIDWVRTILTAGQASRLRIVDFTYVPRWSGWRSPRWCAGGPGHVAALR